MSVEERLNRIEEWIEKCDEKLETINKELGELVGESSSIKLLVKWVITPLLFILAGLVGIKLVMPS